MQRKRTESKQAIRGIQKVPEDTCPSCGATMRPSRRALVHLVNGEAMRVGGIPHLHCSRCHEMLLHLDHMRTLEQRAIAAYREKYRLLSGSEIRALRVRLHLTQSQLSDLLRLGANTVSRWEAGRNVQSASMDVLLRLLRDLPQTLQYLRKRAA